MSADGELDALIAERAIRRKLLEYCRGIDRCDAGLVASVYHPDATDDHGSYRGPAQEFALRATAQLRETCEATMHALGDSLIDLDGDVAHVETYVLAFHRRHDADGPFLEKFGGRYLDRFERREGKWLIAERTCVREWDAVERVELAFRPGRFREGRRDSTDLAYRS